MNKLQIYDYASAEKHINAGRNKTYRAVQGHLYAVRRGTDTIELVFNYKGNWREIPVLTYHSNGNITLSAGYPYQSCRRIMSQYVKGLVVSIKKGQTIVSLDTDGTTPIKTQKCRTCRGIGSFAKLCGGPIYCHDDNCEILISTSDLLRQWEQGLITEFSYSDYYSARAHTHGPCEHGMKVSHFQYNDRYECGTCQGKGRANYGNKRKGRVWDYNYPFTISKDGYPIEKENGCVLNI